MNHVIQYKHKERGQSMIELALMLTILMVLLAGTVDLGRAFFTWLAMRDAAQEGASYASIEPLESVKIEERVRFNINDTIREPAAIVQVNVSFDGPRCLSSTPSTVTVNVNYENFPITMPFLGTLLGSQTIPIHATVDDTILAPMCP